MYWQINEDVSFCRLDGRLVFLDIKKDHYFQLREPLEHEFIAHLDAHKDSLAAADLARYGVLLATSSHTYPSSARTICVPSNSAIERRHSSARLSFSDVFDVITTVAFTQFQLKTYKLKRVLLTLEKNRWKKIASTKHEDQNVERHLIEAAINFRRARIYVPIETCCLLDSISMLRYLAKRGFRAQLVLGVACDPFSAHAWVQCGNLVANDTVGSAQSHVPIRVI